jgi:hypothetical protein
MSDKKRTSIFIVLITLTISVFACSLPTPTAVQLTATPYIPTTLESPEPPTESTETSPTSTEDVPPTEAIPTDIPPEATETSAPTPTVTPIPPAPTSQPTAEVIDTEAPQATIEPLVFVDKGYEIADWTALPGKEWEGHLRLVFRGGVPPYTSSIGHRDPQSENLHYFRYAACKGAAVRADVWSSDGQHQNQDLWVEAPWCPTEEP